MSCTCEYGSKRVCEFCEHRAQVNARLKKLEDAQASAARPPMSAEAIARLRKRVRLHRVGMSHVPETCELCAIRALLEAYDTAHARGIAEERARVVAWLREVVETMRRNRQSYGVVEEIADAIERGEHEEDVNE